MSFISRREWLTQSGAVLALLWTGIPVMAQNETAAAVHCGSCGATCRSLHPFREGAVDGLFCPNCGTLSSGIGPVRGIPVVSITSAPQSAIEWDSDAVPFPDPTLIILSNKPCVKFMESTW